MVFSYEVKVQELQATRIVNDYPEYEWNINGEKKKIDETGDFVWRKGFGWPKFLSIAEKIKVVEEIIISKEGQLGNHSMPAEIACELNFDYQSVSRIVDQDLDLRVQRKHKIQKLIDSNIKKCTTYLRKLLCKYTLKTLQTIFLCDRKIFKMKRLYNLRNVGVFVPK